MNFEPWWNANKHEISDLPADVVAVLAFTAGMNHANDLRQDQAVKMAKRKAGVSRGRKVQVTCGCGKRFEARLADVNRGWGKYCSKSCAAKYRK